MASPDELDPRLRALLDEERGTRLRGVDDAKARGLARLMATIAATDVGDAGGDGEGSSALDEKLAGKGDKTGKPEASAAGEPTTGPEVERPSDLPGESPNDLPSDLPGDLASLSEIPKPALKPGVNELVRPALATVSTKTLVWVAVMSGVAGAVVGATTMWAVTKPEAPPPLEASTVDEAVVVPAPELVDAALLDEVPVEAPSDETPVLPSRVERPETTRMRGSEARPEEPTVDHASTPPRDVPRSALARERALIDQARAALRAGRPHDALVALMGHEREFAEGTLAEERERLAIEALVRSDRLPAARRKAAAFVTRFPSSAHRARIEALVAE
ncbi:MAG: hypothetical protein R3B99_26895 [Polyangiales bacterium]